MKKEGVQTRKRKPRNGENKRRGPTVNRQENQIKYIIREGNSGMEPTNEIVSNLQQSYEDNCQHLLQQQQQLHLQHQQMMIVQESQLHQNGKFKIIKFW